MNFVTGLIIILFGVIVTLGLNLIWTQGSLADQRNMVASLERELTVVRQAAALNKAAMERAESARALTLERAHAYDTLRATLEGDIDAPLPDWMRGYLERLLTGSTDADPDNRP